MKMNILITESQERMILNESIGNELGNILRKNSDIGKLITFGASIGGMMGPVGNFLEGKYPSMNDVEISLLLTGVIATFLFNSPKLVKKVTDKIKEQGLENEFEAAKSKTEELRDTFYDFMESLNITLFKVTNVLGFAFLIPLLPYIHELSSGNLTIQDINKIVKILTSYGIITISSATLKEIIVKLIKRFRG